MNAPAHTINANPADTHVELKEMKFRFKKDKTGSQRPTVELKKVPVPSVTGLINIIETGGKSLELLLEVASDTIRAALASYISDNEAAAENNIPWNKFTWKAVAEAPRAERSTIAAELWDAFTKDYLEVMPAVSGKTPDQLGNACQVYLKKFSIIKTNKPIIKNLQQQLGLYMEHSKKAEDFVEILELLNDKAKAYLEANDIEQLVANL